METKDLDGADAKAVMSRAVAKKYSHTKAIELLGAISDVEEYQEEYWSIIWLASRLTVCGTGADEIDKNAPSNDNLSKIKKIKNTVEVVFERAVKEKYPLTKGDIEVKQQDLGEALIVLAERAQSDFAHMAGKMAEKADTENAAETIRLASEIAKWLKGAKKVLESLPEDTAPQPHIDIPNPSIPSPPGNF